MANSLDALAELLSRLRISGDPVVILKELKTAVLSLSSEKVEDLARNISLTPVFDKLNSNDSEQISLACDLLNCMLSTLNPSAIFTQFQAELQRGLQHPNCLVKEMVLKQIKRCAMHQNLLLNSNSVILTVVQLCGDDDLSVAKHAMETIVELSKTRAGLNFIFAPPIVERFKESMKKSDTVRFRIYEIIVKISKQSVLGLQMSIDSGLMVQFLKEYQQDDILIQLNCLELMSELAAAEHTLHYLEEERIISYLEKMLQQQSMEGTGGFLLPGLIKFFGNMGHLHPKEVCERFPAFINIIFKYIESNDQTLYLIAFETVSMIGASIEGKLTLEKYFAMMNNCMEKLGNTISNAPSELRVKAMNAVSLLLDLKTDEQTTELLLLTESWFNRLCKEPMQLVFNLCRQPFADLRCAALGVVQSLAVQPWGQRKMSQFPGFLEYLLDRNTETDKEGKELKYEIISLLVYSPTSSDIFGSYAMTKLKEFVKEGPFYVFTQAEVAIDGAS